MIIDTPLRVAVWHNLPSGGGRRALHAHIRGLLDRGHHVEIWCPDQMNDKFLPLGDLAPEHVIPISGAARKGHLAEAADILRGVRADIQAMNGHCLKCAEEITAGDFDVLFSNTSRDFAVTAIGRFTEGPSVLYLQEPLRELYEASPDLPWSTPGPRSSRQRSGLIRHSLRTRKLGILVREEQRNARAFDEILVNSYFSRESVMRAYGLDASVCYLGVDTTRFKSLGLARERTVIGVGAIVPAKAIEQAIEAVALVQETRPKLVWIGNVFDQGYRQHLEQLAEERGVGLELRVDVSDEELVAALNRASVMVYTPRLEPFGYAPLEASACGLPVVGIREGGVRETVRDGFSGYLADADPASIAAGLETVLADPELGRRLGRNGQQWVTEEWTNDKSIDRLERHLVDAVDTAGLESRR